VDSFWYTLSEAWSGVYWADLMAAQGAFGTDFHDRSILRPKHRAYYRSGRPVIKIGPKGALGSHEIHPIHSAPSLGQSILVLDLPSLIPKSLKKVPDTKHACEIHSTYCIGFSTNYPKYCNVKLYSKNALNLQGIHRGQKIT